MDAALGIIRRALAYLIAECPVLKLPVLAVLALVLANDDFCYYVIIV
jgi:hypothetical protein